MACLAAAGRDIAAAAANIHTADDVADQGPCREDKLVEYPPTPANHFAGNSSENLAGNFAAEHTMVRLKRGVAEID